MTEPKALIAPGEPFEVSYASDKRATVICLSLSSQRKLASLVKSMIAAEQSGDPMQCADLFDMAESAIRIAIPDVTDEFLDTIDAQMAIEISTACLGKQSVSDDDKKKSE